VQLREEEAVKASGQADEVASTKLEEARLQFEEELCERERKLESEAEELRRLAGEAEESQAAQRQEVICAEEATHAAEERKVELMEAQASLAEAQKNCSTAGDSALEERDTALRDLEALQAKHSTQETQLQALAQEFCEREQAGEESATEAGHMREQLEATTRREEQLQHRLDEALATATARAGEADATKEKLEAATKRIADLEGKLSRATESTQAASSIAGLVANAVHASDEAEDREIKLGTPTVRNSIAIAPRHSILNLAEDGPPALVQAPGAAASLATAAAGGPPQLVEELVEVLPVMEPLDGEELPYSIPEAHDDDLL